MNSIDIQPKFEAFYEPTQLPQIGSPSTQQKFVCPTKDDLHVQKNKSKIFCEHNIVCVIHRFTLSWYILNYTHLADETFYMPIRIQCLHCLICNSLFAPRAFRAGQINITISAIRLSILRTLHFMKSLEIFNEILTNAYGIQISHK